jgi:hypothetical protein
MIDRMCSLLKIQKPVPGSAGLLLASGATVPTSGTRGYQTGCIFQHTDGSTGTAFYVNEGTASSCSFQAVAALTAAQEALISATAGTVTASKAVVVDAAKAVNEWNVTATSASTSGSSSVEPVVVSSTMTGVGGVGGRARFQLDSNVALGGWANALKAYTKFGASGRITGLASSLCAEMDLTAGTTQGTYAPIEIELNFGTTGKTGTNTSLIYASVNGTSASEFDTAGYILNLQGLTANTDKVFQASAKAAICSTHAIRIKIGATAYFIPLHTSAAFGV